MTQETNITIKNSFIEDDTAAVNLCIETRIPLELFNAIKDEQLTLDHLFKLLGFDVIKDKKQRDEYEKYMVDFDISFHRRDQERLESIKELNAFNRNRLILEKVKDLSIQYGLNTKWRKRELVDMRYAIMFWLCLHTDKSLASIGTLFGNDHATVLHGKRAIVNAFETNGVTPEMELILNELKPYERP